MCVQTESPFGTTSNLHTEGEAPFGQQEKEALANKVKALKKKITYLEKENEASKLDKLTKKVRNNWKTSFVHLT